MSCPASEEGDAARPPPGYSTPTKAIRNDGAGHAESNVVGTMDGIQVLLPAWRASGKNSFSPFDTQVPSQRTLVLNIVNSFKTDNSNASSFGNSMEVVLVPTFPVRASQLSGWSSFSEGFQWPLNRSQIEPSCEVWRLRTKKIKESIHIRKICGLDSQHGASSISKLLCNLIVIVA